MIDTNDTIIKRKSKREEKYNFILQEVINNFSFYDFVTDIKKSDVDGYSGFVVITPKQYVIGYTASFGEGTHAAAFARVQKDINGGGHIISETEAKRLTNECENKYITARMLYEKAYINSNGLFSLNGEIHFRIPDKISEEEFNSFKKFYKDYNDDIVFAIKRSNNTFKISFYHESTKIIDNLYSLDEIYNLLETIIDYNITDEDEIIIGTPKDQLTKKRK